MDLSNLSVKLVLTVLLWLCLSAAVNAFVSETRHLGELMLCVMLAFSANMVYIVWDHLEGIDENDEN